MADPLETRSSLRNEFDGSRENHMGAVMGPKKLDNTVARFLAMADVVDPLERRSTPACDTIPNLVAVGQNVGVGRGPKNWGTLGPAPWEGAWLTPVNTLLHHLCYRAKFGYSRSNHMSRSARKI